MRIAVASEKSLVAGHFGHCENFNIYDVADGDIVRAVSVANPGHRPGFLPNWLNDQGVRVIISGGMGGGAIEIFNEKGIEVVTGASGEAQTAVREWVGGRLKSTGSVCNHHDHHDSCGGH